jgi:hypothetical protein
MASHQFFADGVGHIAERELTALFSDRRLHQYLEQNIAQLLAKFRHRSLIDRLENFVGLFEHGRA